MLRKYFSMGNIYYIRIWFIAEGNCRNIGENGLMFIIAIVVVDLNLSIYKIIKGELQVEENNLVEVEEKE